MGLGIRIHGLLRNQEKMIRPKFWSDDFGPWLLAWLVVQAVRITVGILKQEGRKIFTTLAEAEHTYDRLDHYWDHAIALQSLRRYHKSSANPLQRQRSELRLGRPLNVFVGPSRAAVIIDEEFVIHFAA
jgi:hypothetical protein